MPINWHPRLRLQLSDGSGTTNSNCVTYDNRSASVAASLNVRLHLIDVPVVSSGVRRVDEAQQSGRTVRGGCCRKTCEDNIISKKTQRMQPKNSERRDADAALDASNCHDGI